MKSPLHTDQEAITNLLVDAEETENDRDSCLLILIKSAWLNYYLMLNSDHVAFEDHLPVTDILRL